MSKREEGASAASETQADAVVLKLTTPVVLGELTYTQLKFPARLQGRHLRRYDSNDAGRIDANVCLRVAADACGVPDRVMDELAAEDVQAVMVLMLGFFVRAGFIRASPAS